MLVSGFNWKKKVKGIKRKQNWGFDQNCDFLK